MDLKMEVTQTLGLSQRMIQSTEILQMSAQELDTYLKELAVENPVVDIEEKFDKSRESERDAELQKKLEWLASSDEQNRVYYSEEYSSDDDDNQDMWNVSDNRGEDLAEYLISQLVTIPLTDKEQAIAEYLIDLLDSRGYLTEETDQIATQLETEEDEVARMLQIVQGLEPAGVGARNLSECLLIQMDRQKIEDTIARKIAANYLEQLGKNQLPQIARKLKVTVDDVLQAMEVIRELNPKPGNSFSSRENLKYITPDVTVVKLKDYYEILLNEYMYPKMSINGYYRNMLKAGNDKETKDYVTTKVKQAEWVMQCVSQRNVTLMNVSKCIVDVQERFFTYGPGYLRPLKLADVAEMVGIHESTVSRAVKDKYLQCSWGIFPMNYFFIGAISKAGNENAATADTAKNLLKEIIADENHEKPYSDRVLSEKLAERGVKISRRTVAKYREAMGIKDASGRKVF